MLLEKIDDYDTQIMRISDDADIKINAITEKITSMVLSTKWQLDQMIATRNLHPSFS